MPYGSLACKWNLSIYLVHNLSCSCILFRYLVHVVPDPEPPVVIILYEWSGISDLFALCSLCFCCNIIKCKQFLYGFIIVLHLIYSFLLTRSLFIPYAYVSAKSIDCILLSSLELRAILLISSLGTWYLSLLCVYCVFNIS